VYDRFVIDTAPLNAVSDSLYLLRHATATCLVIRAGSTPAAGVQRALKTLRGGKAKDIGIILNELERQYFNRYSKPYHAEGVYGATGA
jgi:Mrp family chromosome partitioning ATPase